jgi:hypothetical protein
VCDADDDDDDDDVEAEKVEQNRRNLVRIDLVPML